MTRAIDFVGSSVTASPSFERKWGVTNAPSVLNFKPVRTSMQLRAGRRRGSLSIIEARISESEVKMVGFAGMSLEFRDNSRSFRMMEILSVRLDSNASVSSRQN